MKKIKFLSGMSAVFALAAVALATTFTSCEKEEFNVNVIPVNAQAVISPSVYAVTALGTTDITAEATISGTLTFTGAPTIAAQTVTITATYHDFSASVNVKVPALQAGQFATLTPTILLSPDFELDILSEEVSTTEVEEEAVFVDNYELYWDFLNDFSYIEKSGVKVGEIAPLSSDVIYRDMFKLFAATMDETYQEEEKVLPANTYKVYAMSRTIINITYEIEKSIITLKKSAATRAEGEAEVIGTITMDSYSTTIASVVENQDIPGHGHSMGHGHGFNPFGHGHGDDANAGGGIGQPD